jgi:hypothetical protein
VEFKVLGKPIYYFNLSVKQVEVLQKCSQFQNDSTCKAAGVCGGLIYGWKQLSDAMTPDEKVFHRGDFRDLDLALKILETGWLLSDEDKLIASELKNSFRSILLRSDLYRDWHVEGVIV